MRQQVSFQEFKERKYTKISREQNVMQHSDATLDTFELLRIFLLNNLSGLLKNFESERNRRKL